MILPKQSSVNGAWIDKKGLKSGDVIKFVTEPKVEEGQNGPQVVAKAQVKGSNDEPKNLAINKPSQRALTESLGEDTVNWMNKPFAIEIEKTNVGGKRGLALYVIPDGYEVGEDDGGYVVVKKIGSSASIPHDTPIEYPKDDINPEDIPF